MGNGDVAANRAQPDSFESTALSSVASSSVLLSGADEIALALLELVAEVEASLRGSQKAVLAIDGLGLENCTREQVRLHRAVEMLLWPRAWPGTAEKDALTVTPRSVPRFVTECAPFLAGELLAAERRVLQGTRLPISEVSEAAAPDEVSLDEDAATIVQYRQAYDASAQVIATIHDMMYAVIKLSTLLT
jgi:hypothetical protein